MIRTDHLNAEVQVPSHLTTGGHKAHFGQTFRKFLTTAVRIWRRCGQDILVTVACTAHIDNVRCVHKHTNNV